MTPRIGTQLETDIETLVSGKHAAEIRELLQQRGVLLIWDNTGTMHRVDAYPLEEGRMMHRTTIEAEQELA